MYHKNTLFLFQLITEYASQLDSVKSELSTKQAEYVQLCAQIGELQVN